MIYLQRIVNFIKKPLYYLLILFMTLLMVQILVPVVSGFKLYVSYKDSIIELGKLTHIAVKKANRLQFKIGHSDSAYPVKDDNFKIDFKKDEYQHIWFQLVNNDTEDVYRNVMVSLDFNDRESSKQIEVSIPDTEKFWNKFKDGYFNAILIDPIGPKYTVQLYSLKFKFKNKGVYHFMCIISADGYRPKKYIKHFVVQ